jgi:hypothetical protein
MNNISPAKLRVETTGASEPDQIKSKSPDKSPKKSPDKSPDKSPNKSPNKSPTNHENLNHENQIKLFEDSELLSTSKAFYVSLEDNPNMIVLHKLETILDKMQDEKIGVPIRTVKNFLTKIPSVFTGNNHILKINYKMSKVAAWHS